MAVHSAKDEEATRIYTLRLPLGGLFLCPEKMRKTYYLEDRKAKGGGPGPRPGLPPAPRVEFAPRSPGRVCPPLPGTSFPRLGLPRPRGRWFAPASVAVVCLSLGGGGLPRSVVPGPPPLACRGAPCGAPGPLALVPLDTIRNNSNIFEKSNSFRGLPAHPYRVFPSLGPASFGLSARPGSGFPR